MFSNDWKLDGIWCFDEEDLLELDGKIWLLAWSWERIIF
jgi:hypothetical protein